MATQIREKFTYPLGVLLSLLVGVSYGLATPFSKMLVTSGVSPITIVLFRTIFPLFFWGLVLYFRGGFASFRIEPPLFLCFFLIGFFAYVLKASCLVMSYRYMSVQFAIMLSYLSPICTIFLNASLNREKPKTLQILAAVLVILALTLAFDDFSFESGGIVAGLFFAGVSVVGSSLNSAYSSFVARKYSPDITQQIFYTHACAAILLFAIKATFFGFDDLARIGGKDFFNLTMVAVTTSLVATYCFFKAVKLVSSSLVQILSSTELLMTLLFVPMIANVQPTLHEVFGSILIFIALSIATLEGGKTSKTKQSFAR